MFCSLVVNVINITVNAVLIFGFGMGAVGVWIAMVIDWVCRSAFFVGRFVSGKWKTKYKA